MTTVYEAWSMLTADVSLYTCFDNVLLCHAVSVQALVVRNPT